MNRTATQTQETRIEILRHMARAFFASAWADAAEEANQSAMLSGKDIMDIMPRIVDESAYVAARTLCFDMERINGADIVSLFDKLCAGTVGEGDREHSAEMFGHYAAMQAMGHGVGLDDAFGSKARDLLTVPYVEFGQCSLSRDYF
jgi:hypothetical protein